MTSELVRSIALGALQGATEFLPVSSSGHLVLVPALLGWPLPALAFDATIHLATAAAAALYLRRDWTRMLGGFVAILRARSLSADADGRLLLLVLLAVAPAAVAGVVLRDVFEAMFMAPRLAGAMMFVTAALLVGAEWASRRDPEDRPPSARSALQVGLAQAVSIVPGISRSGATIAGGQLSGFSRETATRFSFLVAVPVILGAGLFELVGMASRGLPTESPVSLGAAGVTAFIVGYVTVGWMLSFVAHRTLLPFAAYTVLIGVVALLVL